MGRRSRRNLPAPMPKQPPGPRVRAAGLAALDSLFAENRAAATRLRVCHALFVACEEEQLDRALAAGFGPGLEQDPDYMVIDPLDVACAEIVAVYGVHTNRARALITMANELTLKFPALLAAMDDGRLDEDTASKLARRMRTVDSSQREAVQRAVATWLLGTIDEGRRPGLDAILNKVDDIINEHDPDGVTIRRQQAFLDRNVKVRPKADGMADLVARMSGPDALAIHNALTELAHEHKRTSPGVGNLDQLRSDILVDALLSDSDEQAGSEAEAGSETGSEGAPDPKGLAASIRPRITVLAPLGPDGEPEVFLPRGGQASIESLIALLSRSIGSTITVPETAYGSADSPTGARRYRISAEMARRIRLRDGTCRHPGCSVQADSCDIDHIRPFDHTDPSKGGLSVESNLMCLCRRHHRFKTFHDWIYHLAPDGTLTITTDTGHTITTEPAGPLARWRVHTSGNPDAEDPYDAETRPRPRPWLTPEPRPTYKRRREQRLKAERQANIDHRNTPRPDKEGPIGNHFDDDPPPF